MSHSARLLKDYRLTTAQIIYYLPDHPRLLQTFVWQEYDHAPAFPALHKFIEFWRANIEGRLHSVQVASAALVRPAEFRLAAAHYTLH